MSFWPPQICTVSHLKVGVFKAVIPPTLRRTLRRGYSDRRVFNFWLWLEGIGLVLTICLKIKTKLLTWNCFKCWCKQRMQFNIPNEALREKYQETEFRACLFILYKSAKFLHAAFESMEKHCHIFCFISFHFFR